MTTATDFLLDAEGDLLITTQGDFTTGNSEAQHISHLLLAFPGYYRQTPLVGTGIRLYQKSAGAQLELQRKIFIQLQADNYLVEKVVLTSLTPLKINVDAERIR